MQGTRHFPGGVFSGTIDGGRAGATVSLTRDAVVAVTSEGQAFRVRFAECRLELGGASGKMWFCRTPDRALTIFCEAPGFREALEQDARMELGGAIERVAAQARSRGQKVFFLGSAVLGLSGVLLVAALLGIRHAARSSIDMLPHSVDAQLGELRGKVWVQTRTVNPFLTWVHPYRPQNRRG
jgi:beta-barrel assembly-enhancing protease